MIDDEDISEDVISIKCQQIMDTDSNHGRDAIIPINSIKKYTMHLLPQADKIVITLYGWEYDSESESIAAGGHANAGYQIVQGSFAELSSQQKFCGLIEAILSSRLI